MENVFIRQVKDCSLICSDGKTVLLCGKYLWIYRVDGTLVAKHKTIRIPYKVAFLPGNKAIVDASCSEAYYYISLDTGEILWSTLKKGRRTCESQHFCVSPSGKTVYATCKRRYGNNPFGVLLIDRLQPEAEFHDMYMVSDGLRATADIFCDTDDQLCVFQAHQIVNPDEPYDDKPKPTLWQNGLLSVTYSKENTTHCWDRYWISEGRYQAFVEGCSRTHLLYKDLTVMNMDTFERFSLVSDEERQRLPWDSFSWSYDSTRNFLFIYYTGCHLNIVIDCKERKVVSQYVFKGEVVAYQGCLIDNEYWFGTTDGVVKYPFPNMDPIPEKISRWGKPN